MAKQHLQGELVLNKIRPIYLRHQTPSRLFILIEWFMVFPEQLILPNIFVWPGVTRNVGKKCWSAYLDRKSKNVYNNSIVPVSANF